MAVLLPWLNWTHTRILGDPFFPTRNVTTLPLFFGGPMDQVTNYVCREISSSNEASTSAQSRCMTLLSQSIRSQRIGATTADADLYEFRRDGLILMLTYVYDDDSMVYKSNSASNVDYYCSVETQQQNEVCTTTRQQHRPQICVFGEFSLQIAALAYLMRYNLHWVFTSGEDKILSTPEAFDTLLSTWQEEGLQLTYTVAADTDEDESWLSLLRKQGTETVVECDVWHFRVDSAGQQLANIFKIDSVAILRPAQVVWESTLNIGDSLDMSKPPDILPSVLHWDAFSLWPVCTVFNGMTDAEGFKGARAVALDFKNDLRLYAVWVGRVKPLSFTLPTDSFVPLTTSTTGKDTNIDEAALEVNGEVETFTSMMTNPTVVIAITYTNRVFDDNAYGLYDVLTSLGYRHVFVMGDFSLTKVRKWQSQFQQGQKHLFLQIALGPHELCMLTPNYIAYNMEQPWSMYFTDASHSVGYRMLLAGALAVFTFSNHHRDGIIRLSDEYDLGIRADRIFNIPIYITTVNGPEITRPLFRRNSYMSSLFVGQDKGDDTIERAGGEEDDEEETVEVYDIAFFGGSSARRLAFFNRFQEHSERHQFNFRVVCGGWEVALFGDRRDYVVLRSRVVLNIHGTWQSSLELHRIQYLLSMGAAVVSERSAVDPNLDEEYADAVVFGGDASAILGSGTINTAEQFSGQIGDIETRKAKGSIEDIEYVVTEQEIQNFDDILDKAFYLARNTTARRDVERKAWQQYQKSVQNVSELQRAMQLIILDVIESPGAVASGTS